MTQNTDNPGMVDSNPPTDPDELLTVRQVARLLGLNERYTRNELVKPGHIRSIRLGKGGPKARYRIKRRWVGEFTEGRRKAKAPRPGAHAAA